MEVGLLNLKFFFLYALYFLVDEVMRSQFNPGTKVTSEQSSSFFSEKMLWEQATIILGVIAKAVPKLVAFKVP